MHLGLEIALLLGTLLLRSALSYNNIDYYYDYIPYYVDVDLYGRPLVTPKPIDYYDYECQYWFYPYAYYCQEHVGITPFPGLSWELLEQRWNGRWWDYPCVYYTEQALLFAQSDVTDLEPFYCGDNLYELTNGTWTLLETLDDA